jgi:hypothetical protein
MENNEATELENDPKYQERIKEIEEIVKAEKIEPTTALNILINAVQVTFESNYFNDLDKFLIAKALTCFKEYVDSGENFMIKVKD